MSYDPVECKKHPGKYCPGFGGCTAYCEQEKQMTDPVFDKVEYDENGRRLSHKPNSGFKLGSYSSKHKRK